MSILQALRPFAGRVVGFGALVYCFDTYVMGVTTCVGASMLPILNADGTIVLVDRISPRVGGLKPGDVVTAVSPLNPNSTICNRILGMEGDRLKVPPPAKREAAKYVTVPNGHVWLQGDNQYVSLDSRHYGPVPAALVKGKVFFKIWPPSAMGPVESRIP